MTRIAALLVLLGAGAAQAGPLTTGEAMAIVRAQFLDPPAVLLRDVHQTSHEGANFVTCGQAFGRDRLLVTANDEPTPAWRRFMVFHRDGRFMIDEAPDSSLNPHIVTSDQCNAAADATTTPDQGRAALALCRLGQQQNRAKLRGLAFQAFWLAACEPR